MDPDDRILMEFHCTLFFNHRYYAPRFFRKVKPVCKCLDMGEEGGSKTGYLCLVSSAKLNLPMLQVTSFQGMLQQEQSSPYINMFFLA